MPTPEIDQLIEGYLARLDALLAPISELQRTQLVGEVRQHIADACDEHLLIDEATVRTILEHLGPPEAIAAAALVDVPSEAPPHTGRWTRARIGLLSGAAAVVALVVVGFFTVVTPHPATSPDVARFVPATLKNGVPVPNVIGQPVPVAMKDLTSLGLHVLVREVSPQVHVHGPATVVSEDAAAGTLGRHSGPYVILEVSAGSISSPGTVPTTVVASAHPSTTTTMPR